MVSTMSLLGLAVLAPVEAYKCPGSGSFVHASCKVTAVAAADCADVAAEIKARASAQGGWVDPHNGGIYNVTSASDSELQTQRSTNPKTSVGHQVYTDKQIFTLTPQGSSCQIDACSESQGTSVGDFSTNYCDMRNLYCGSADGCKPVAKDFTSTESSVSPSIGAGHDFSKCIVKPELTTSAYKCPGSKSPIHASCKVTAVAAADCADVAAEIKARASAQGGWVDPHNGGIYNVTSASDSELQTQRSTNPKTSVGHQVYTDKQIFTLTSQGSSCQIDACSESQGTSVGDFSTNYCDMRNLYCGSADGCKPVTKDFTSTESSVSPSIGAGHDFSKCVVKPSTVVV